MDNKKSTTKDNSVKGKIYWILRNNTGSRNPVPNTLSADNTNDSGIYLFEH